MSTTFANSIDSNPIYADRAENDKDGNRIDQTYAKSASLATVATTGDYDDLIDKPDLSIYAETANLATVATTGDYDDLVNKPTIPAAQVNSDWNSNSGVSQILNKPTLSTVATTGDYDDLINKPSIPAAQVNADWNSSSGVSEILNKPTLAAVATSGDYADLSGTPTINNVPAVTSSDDNKVLKASYTGGVGSYSWENETGTTYSAGNGIDIDQNNAISVENPLPASTSAEAGKYLKVDANGDPTWATGGGGGGGVNADWTEDDPLEPSYIENKPTPKTLTAGANISISEGVGTLTISAAAGLPASTSADEGKCLVVDSNGDPEWGTGGKTYTGTDGVVVDNVNDTVGLEAPVDIVGGPGIVIDNPDGNTLRVSQAYPTDETVLCDTVSNSSCTLSEAYTNFERIRIEWQYGSTITDAEFSIVPMLSEYYTDAITATTNRNVLMTVTNLNGNGASAGQFVTRVALWKFNGTTTFEFVKGYQLYNGSTTASTAIHIRRIIGIHRIANN